MYNVLVMLQSKQIQRFVDNLLVFESSPRFIANADELAWRIWKILTEEKRLARRPDAAFKDIVLGKIRRSIELCQPIVMINAFGGFKNYKAPSFPHVDWAEVFALSKLVKQCVNIAAIHEPGVKLEFTGDSEMLTFFNNYPADTIATYALEFKQLLGIFQKAVPRNVRLTYRGLAEDYDLKVLEQRVAELAGSLPKTRADELFRNNGDRARNNFMLQGVVDYSNATDAEVEAVLRRSVVLDHCFIDIDLADRHEYLEGGLHVPLIQTAIPGCIALKSVGTSKLAFWLGTGYLMAKGDKLIPCIQHGQKWGGLNGVEYHNVESPFAVIPGFDRIPLLVSDEGKS